MGIRTEIENGMGDISFEPGDGIVTMTPKGKGMHFELNWNGNDEKYTDVIHCSFDIDDVSLMLENKSKWMNISWERKTDNWSGPFGTHWWGIWYRLPAETEAGHRFCHQPEDSTDRLERAVGG